MIRKYVDRFIAKEEQLKAELLEKRPESYDALVERMVRAISDPEDYEYPDPKRITIIDHGDYQGTRLYVIGADGYQPSTYWLVCVSYGSCSGCDTFQANAESFYDDDDPAETARRREKEAQGNYTMMLHMVQSMKQICG